MRNGIDDVAAVSSSKSQKLLIRHRSHVDVVDVGEFGEGRLAKSKNFGQTPTREPGLETGRLVFPTPILYTPRCVRAAEASLAADQHRQKNAWQPC